LKKFSDKRNARTCCGTGASFARKNPVELNIGSNQPQMLTTIAQLKNAQPAPSIKASIMFIPSFTEYSYLLFLFSYLQK
jgi:hypothetical protein